MTKEIAPHNQQQAVKDRDASGGAWVRRGFPGCDQQDIAFIESCHSVVDCTTSERKNA